MSKEKRKRTRALIGFDITILFQQKTINVKTMNISLTGICCTSSKSFRAGEECAVILKLNSDTSLNIKGKILRVDDKEAIISFLSMEEDTFYHLKRLMQYNVAEPDTIENELMTPAFLKDV